ncbi:hypothetical protein EW146_g2145 [Bondarzewia mesenterica]|uniref:Uncharacterized protein n=1 Tax=Bondarzewia mesenterica TaxID=1095465 RepID=A0A4S4M1M1_9AGAM|nr:hypothetical protein EW146_g2145 [Bondarzewia mesenterica]
MTTATTHAPGGYSSIFSSGLLATPRPHGRMDSPNSRPSSPTTSPMITDLESTPTGLKQSFSEYPPSTSPPSHFLDTDNGSSRSRASSTSSFTAPQAPKLRRRKSSITVGSSAMGSIKSPLRSAGAALQRTVLMSPTSGSRSRSGSLSVDAGPELQLGSTPRTGRMRSGSLGDVLRSRRAIRKPPTAPPSMPLPPPPVPILSQASAPPTEQFFRRPLTHRSYTSENYVSFGTYLTPDFTNKLVAALNTPPGSASTSPVDGGLWAGRDDPTMKEN